MSALEKLLNRFLKNPKAMDKGAGFLAKEYRCTPEDVKEARRLAREQMLGRIEEKVELVGEAVGNLAEQLLKVDNTRGTLESTVESLFDPRNDEELAQLHKVDLSKYKISNYWSKLKSNGKFTSSVLCTLRKTDKDLEKQKELLLEELKAEFPVVPAKNYGKDNKKYAYEVSCFDVHFGKLAWGEESGEDYDLKIAEARYTDAINHLVSMVSHKDIERIIFPIGNDMVQIDGRDGATTAGTIVDSDSRFYKMVRAVKKTLIESINTLSQIAPVDVIVVSGNHDTETMFMIGEMLDAYFHNNANVTVDNSPRQRKYYRYGANGFQYTHGNEEKHNDLGLIFATEESALWAATTYRWCKLGHFHKSKKIQYVSVDEFQGFQVQILPSLSSSDAWHKSKGYMSRKAAKGFLYHKEYGQVGEFTYNA